MPHASLEKLITALHRLHPEADAEAVADWLWLAAHNMPVMSLEEESPDTPLPVEEKTPFQEFQPPRSEPEKPSQPKTEDWQEPSAPEPEIEQEQEPAAELHAPAAGNDAKNASGLPFRTPGGRALPHPLEITRALRPLLRQIVAPGTQVLDEDATVRRIADSGVWLPVFRAKKERWLELALVFDDSPSMRLWHHTLKELRDLLMQQGAFHDVRVWKLKTTGKDLSVFLYTETGQAARHYKELINPARSRLILVVSDCVSPAWQGAGLIEWLEAWGREHPVSLVQLLPQDLWPQTRLRNARFLKITVPAPAAANRHLQTRQRFLPRLKPMQQQSIVLPLTTLEPDFLADWARFVAGNGQIVLPAFKLKAVPLAGTHSPQTEADENQRYENFRAAASPIAFKLACFLAAAPLCLPIMRLVQRALVPESGQTHLAEFFLSGLIKRMNNSDEEISDPDNIEYDFLSDALRDRLLGAGLVTDAVQVLEVVSDYIAEYYGLTIDFQAILKHPARFGNILANHKEFAKVLLRVLSQLGPDYSYLVTTLKNSIDLEKKNNYNSLFDQLYISYESRLKNHIRYEFNLTYEDTEEVIQNTFWRIYQALSTNRIKPNISYGRLHLIAKNSAIDFLRATKKFNYNLDNINTRLDIHNLNFNDDDVYSTFSYCQSTDKDIYFSELFNDLLKNHRVSECAKMVMLPAIGLSYEEISKRTGRTPSSLRFFMCDCRKILRQHLLKKFDIDLKDLFADI